MGLLLLITAGGGEREEGREVRVGSDERESGGEWQVAERQRVLLHAHGACSCRGSREAKRMRAAAEHCSCNAVARRLRQGARAQRTEKRRRTHRKRRPE